jgi:hypothetical protein
MRKCEIRGHKEKCLLTGKYPITSRGKLSRKKIKAAESLGKRHGVLSKLKKRGLCRAAKSKGVKLKACHRGSSKK